MKSARKAAALLVSAGAIVALVALVARPASRPTNPVPVIWITVDTLRADHLGLYGYARATSPRLDAFARDAIVYENAITPRSKTTPAIASLHTGRLPHRHGVRTLYQPLEGGSDTLAETLSDAGYATAAFVSNFVLKREYSGLDRGFDVYDDELPTREPRRPIHERTAAATREAATRWVAARRAGPFFLWVHFMDPHGPYRPARACFEAEGVEPIPEGAIPDYQRTGSTNRAEFVARYDAEIRCTDEEIGAFLDELRSRGILDRSLVVFTADHGESLGEHGEWFEHGANACEPCARVPLVIRPPGGRPGGARVSAPASLVDLVPTVRSVLGLPLHHGLDGHALVDASGSPRETAPYRLHEKEDTLRMVRSADRKVVASVERGRIVRLERFDLAADPGERRPIEVGDASWRPLESVLERYVAESVDPLFNLAEIVRRQRASLSEEASDNLRALGYLGR